MKNLNSNKQILGIDPSFASTGFVVLGEDGGICHSEAYTPNKKSVHIKKLDEIKIKLGEILQQFTPCLVVIEGYPFGLRSASQAFSIGELGGMMRLVLYTNAIDYRVIPPGSLKLFATGKGNCHKDLILMNVYKKWNQDFSQWGSRANDVGDAYVLAMIGSYILGGMGSDKFNNLSEYQKRAIREIMKDTGNKEDISNE